MSSLYLGLFNFTPVLGNGKKCNIDLIMIAVFRTKIVVNRLTSRNCI